MKRSLLYENTFIQVINFELVFLRALNVNFINFSFNADYFSLSCTIPTFFKLQHTTWVINVTDIRLNLVMVRNTQSQPTELVCGAYMISKSQ